METLDSSVVDIMMHTAQVRDNNVEFLLVGRISFHHGFRSQESFNSMFGDIIFVQKHSLIQSFSEAKCLLIIKFQSIGSREVRGCLKRCSRSMLRYLKSLVNSIDSERVSRYLQAEWSKEIAVFHKCIVHFWQSFGCCSCSVVDDISRSIEIKRALFHWIRKVQVQKCSALYKFQVKKSLFEQ